MTTVDIDLGSYELGWSDEEDHVFKPEKGLDEELIRTMSEMKKEPEWMLDFRLKAYKRFLAKPTPTWGGGGRLDDIDYDDIYYYIKPTEGVVSDWDMVPDSIKETYEKLGIPEAERKFLAGSPRSTTLRLCTTAIATILRSLVCCSAIWTRPSRSTRSWSRSILARSFRRTTTSLRH